GQSRDGGLRVPTGGALQHHSQARPEPLAPRYRRWDRLLFLRQPRRRVPRIRPRLDWARQLRVARRGTPTSLRGLHRGALRLRRLVGSELRLQVSVLISQIPAPRVRRANDPRKLLPVDVVDRADLAPTRLAQRDTVVPVTGVAELTSGIAPAEIVVSSRDPGKFRRTDVHGALADAEKHVIGEQAAGGLLVEPADLSVVVDQGIARDDQIVVGRLRRGPP